MKHFPRRFAQCRSAEHDAGLGVHALHAGERFHTVAARADARTAGLERLFHRDAGADHGRARVLDERDEPVERRAVGEEIVDDEHAVARREVLARDADGVVIAVRERVHDRRVRIVGDVAALGFLGEHDRAVEHEPGHGRDADAAGLDRDELVHAAAVEQPLPFLRHRQKQLWVHLMVQKPVHFQDLAGFDLALGEDALLEKLHIAPSSHNH